MADTVFQQKSVRIGVPFLLILFIVQAVMSMREKNVTVDEVMYITAGYHHLRTGSFKMNMTHPPLMKLVTAAPLLLLNPELPEVHGQVENWPLVQQSWYATSFLYENHIDPEQILFAARLPVVALGVVLGVYVFLWSRRLYGDGAGLLALFLYVLSPNILAHTRLATNDLGLTAFLFIAAYYFWLHSKRPKFSTIVACTAAFSAAVLTKLTGIAFIPIAGFFTAVLLWRQRLGVWEGVRFIGRIDTSQAMRRQLASAGVTFATLSIGLVGLVNTVYLFEGSFRPARRYDARPEVYKLLPANSNFSMLVGDLYLNTPVPFPEPFVEHVKFQRHNASGRGVYFAGQRSTSGWWYMMLAAFAVKTPIPMLCLLAAALWQLARRRSLSDSDCLILAVPVLFVSAFSYLKEANTGLRYVLPMYPFLHVFVSRVAHTTPRAGCRLALLIVLAWYAAGTVWAYPHYLAYFNEFIGGPSNGYRYLADSNLDWGQDLKGLKKYMDHHGIEKVQLAYFGPGDARHYGIDYTYLPSIGLEPKRGNGRRPEEVSPLPPLHLSGEPLAISATLLAGLFYPDYYAPLRHLQPIAQVGHSILIFDVGSLRQHHAGERHRSHPSQDFRTSQGVKR